MYHQEHTRSLPACLPVLALIQEKGSPHMSHTHLNGRGSGM